MRSLYTTLSLGLAVLCFAPTTRAAGPEDSVPGDSEVVATINVKAMLASDIYKKYGKDQVKKALEDSKVAGILKAIDLDPLKDIESVTAAGKLDFVDTKKGILVIKGKFDEEKIQAAAQAGAKDGKYTYKASKEGSFKVHAITGEDKNTAYVIFTDKNTLLFSLSKDYVLKVAGGKAGKLDAQMAKAMAKATGKESIFASVIITDKIKDLAKVDPSVAKFAEKLEYATFGIVLTDGAKYTLTIQTADAETASALNLLIGFGLPAATAKLKDTPGVPPVALDVLKKIKTATDKNALVITIDLDADMIERIMKEAKPK